MLLDRLPFLIGLRYTRAKRRNHFISFISLTSMLGLSLGVAVLILVLSVMNGFDHELRTRVLGMVPHVRVEARDSVTDWKTLAGQLREKPHVVGAAPYIEQQGMFTASGRNKGALVTGVDPQAEDQVSIISDHMVSGSLADLTPGSWGIVMGELLARNLGVGMGDRVTLLVPEASITPGGIFPRLKRFTVAGIFKVGADVDASLAYTDISDMAKLARFKEGDVQGIRLKLDDLFSADQVTHDIVSQLGSQYRGMDWKRTHGNLFAAIQMEKNMIGLLLMVIVAVAAFNIVSTLVMMVTDKHADIAILRTLGAKPGTIMGIFIVQGLTIGVMGIVIGAIAGVALALSVSDIIAWVQATFGIQFLDPNVYFISYLPSRLEASDMGVILGSALVLSFLSTLYPAWRASRIQPAEVLRYE